jgi:hypothetical protein
MNLGHQSANLRKFLAKKLLGHSSANFWEKGGIHAILFADGAAGF